MSAADHSPDLSYCIVNTNGREYLLACLRAIERTHPPGVEHETIVLDNSSDDGSLAAVEAAGHDVQTIALEARTGKAENDSTLLRGARGRLCLLLNEDCELQEGATAALMAAVEQDERAAVAGAQLLTSDGRPSPSAWRLPGVPVAVAGALFLHRVFTVQSGGRRTRRVGWVQSSAMLVRRDAGWRILHVPAARAVHHDQLSTDSASARRRIVEFHRGRDRYLRKHLSPAERMLVRALGAWFYLVRALAALALPGHDPGRYFLQARQELRPDRGEGIREAAEEYNRRARIAP